MAKIDGNVNMKFLQNSQEEDELSDEFRSVMENEAHSVSPNLVPRRGFLKRIVQVSLPAGFILGAAGTVSACTVFCDENSGCQANCMICQGCHIFICGVPHAEGCGSLR